MRPSLSGSGKSSALGDSAIWGSQGTESLGALMGRERVYFEKGDHARIDDKMQVHHRLAFDEEDVDTDGEDYIYDEMRYVCMKSPIAPRPRKAPLPGGV